MVALDLLKDRRGDFGRARMAGRSQLIAPVCIDALGETWAGYVAEGGERDRAVLVTLCHQPLKSRPAQNILQSACLTKDIRHPKVLALLEVLDDGDELILVSEYMDGEPLSSLLSAAAAQSTQVPEGVALSIVKEAIETLSALQNGHSKAVLHGGLGPESIFVASFGEAMLRHAGIGGVAMQERVFRSRPVALPYRAPEQLRDPRNVTESADVFSAGVILWEMLAGRPLFGHKSHLRLSMQKELSQTEQKVFERRCRTMDIPRLSEIGRPGGTLHPEVVALVHSALSRSPEERPATLHDLAEAIGDLPSKVLSDSVGIASFVERVAGKTIADRLRRLNEGAPFPVYGSSAPSDRVTARPESGPLTVKIPPGEGPLRLGDLLSGPQSGVTSSAGRRQSSIPPDSNRATSPLRPKVDDFEAITTTPSHARKGLKTQAEAPPLPRRPAANSVGDEKPLERKPSSGKPVAVVETRITLAPEKGEVLGASQAAQQTPLPLKLPALDTSPPEGLKLPEKSSGGWLFAALVLVAAGGLSAVLFLGTFDSEVTTAEVDAQSDDAQLTEVESSEVTEKKEPAPSSQALDREELQVEEAGHKERESDVIEGSGGGNNELSKEEPAQVARQPSKPASRPSRPSRSSASPTKPKADVQPNAYRPKGI